MARYTGGGREGRVLGSGRARQNGGGIRSYGDRDRGYQTRDRGYGSESRDRGYQTNGIGPTMPDRYTPPTDEIR